MSKRPIDNLSGPSSSDRSPRTVYVDFSTLEAHLKPEHFKHAQEAAPPRQRFVSTVDEEVGGLRKNVRESARAVLTWMSAVVEHDEQTNLDEVLNRCLRPSTDVTQINYSALADEIRSLLHVDISAKRVKTAIEHLRRHRATTAERTSKPSLDEQLALLHRRLQANFVHLAAADQPLSRSIAVEVLTAVRSAASHLIENDFGEGIPPHVDLDDLADRFLDFVRQTTQPAPRARDRSSAATDLHQLLVALCDFDASTSAHMKLVVAGSKVVCDLMGPHSLAGIVARLNVLVSGRDLFASDAYCRQLLQLADEADALSDDPSTLTFMNWNRRRAKHERLPSPIRIASYCRNNVATHLLERVFKQDVPDAEHALLVAQDCLSQMRRRDRGFQLLRTTEAIFLTVQAQLTGQPHSIESMLRRLGPTPTLALLRDLAQYDNCPQLVRAVQQHAIKVHPTLRHQLIHVA